MPKLQGTKNQGKRTLNVKEMGLGKRYASEAQPVSAEAISTRVTAYHAELVESLFACSSPAANVPLLGSKNISIPHATFGAAVRASAVSSSL